MKHLENWWSDLRLDRGNPALLQYQYSVLQQRVPLMYFLVLANMFFVTLSYYGTAPDYLSVYIPVALALFCSVRVGLWWKRRFDRIEASAESEADLVKNLRTTILLAYVLGLLFTWCGLELFKYGDPYQQAHTAVFIGITVVGSVFCLGALPAASLAIVMGVVPMLCLNFALSGNKVFVAIAANVALVSLVMLKVMLDYYRSVKKRQQAINELRNAKALAETANVAKSRFMATMSHELRTPMNGIIGLTEVLSRTDLEKRQMEYIDTILNSSVSLLGLINDILELSRIEAGKVEFIDDSFDIREAVSSLVDSFAPVAREKGLDLRTEFDVGLDDFYQCDLKSLRLILSNLVGNAIKFTEKGSVTLRVRKDPGKLVYFSVTDTGIGISLENQGLIFDRFHQADMSNTRRYGGTGLGLAICRELITALNGALGVVSAPGEGAKFWFSLPMEPASSTIDESFVGAEALSA